MKILFYTIFLTQGGGVEVVTTRYIKKLLKEGHTVDLYVDYNMGNQNVREKEIDKRVNIKYLKPEIVSKLIYKFRTLGKKYRIFNIPLYILIVLTDYIVWKGQVECIEKKKYDVTITFFQFLPGYITKINGPNHLIFLHGSVSTFFSGIRKFFKDSFFNKLKKFDYICTVSSDMGKELVKMEPSLKDKQVTVYNPIDFDEIKQKANDYNQINEYEKKLLKEKYICSVGRLDESQKDFTTLIKAYSQLKKDNVIEEKLYLIGDGPDKDALKYLVDELDMEKDILFLGKKGNPYIWMKNAKIFILSTKYEGFPTVLMEAMILNVPIISSDCPTGPREILGINNEYGILVEVSNIEQLKNAIYSVLTIKKNIKNEKRCIEFENKIDRLL